MKISITPSAGKSSVVSINCGTASGPKLSGSVDLTQFTSLTSFTCTSHNITVCDLNATNLATLRNIDVSNNKLTGDLPSFAGNTSITNIIYSNNLLNGSIGSIEGCTKLVRISVAGNSNLGGNPPELSSCSALTTYQINNTSVTKLPLLSSPSLRTFYSYSCKLSATLDTNSLTGLPAIREVSLQTQTSPTSLSGRIPDFRDYNPNLYLFYINANTNIVGEIPPLTQTSLTDFRVSFCGLSGFALAPIPSNFLTGAAGASSPKSFITNNNYFTLTATYYALSAFYSKFHQLTAQGVSVTILTGGTFNASGTNMPKLSDAGGGFINGEIYNFVNFLTASPAPKWTIILGSSAIKG